MIETKDYGKELATVHNLKKKQQLLEAEIDTANRGVKYLKKQTGVSIESGVVELDDNAIKGKTQHMNDRYLTDAVC